LGKSDAGLHRKPGRQATAPGTFQLRAEAVLLGNVLQRDPAAALRSQSLVHGGPALEPPLSAVSGDFDPRQRGDDHHRPFSDPRVHEHDPRRRQLRLNDSRHRHPRLGLDFPPQMVRPGQKQSTAREMTASQWDRRIHRANELTILFPFAAEALRFSLRIAKFQQTLYTQLHQLSASRPKLSSDRPLREELDLKLVLPNFSPFLSLIGEIAPEPLSKAAAELARGGPPAWAEILAGFRHSD